MNRKSPDTRWTRRAFFRAGLALPLLFGGSVVDAACIEPGWLKVSRLRLSCGKPVARFVHFTDLHHKGDRRWLQSVVAHINQLEPEFVCFTGDIIEDVAHLPEALELLGGLKSPLYGVPGNHDYWSKADFQTIARGFAATGGAWLLDQSVRVAGGRVNLIGATCQSHRQPPLNPAPDALNVLLMHYPLWVEKLGDARLDLMLAGHSHGGQVRIPFVGPVVVPYGVGKYDLGFFQTNAGPLYVGSGIGWFYLNARFRCRPEITLVEI